MSHSWSYKRILWRFAVAVLALGLWAAACGAARNEAAPRTKEPPAQPLTYDPRVSYAPLVERLSASVVNIFTTQTVKAQRMFPFFFGPDQRGDDPFGQFFGPFLRKSPPKEMKQHSLGSGIIISADGQVLTNRHVVAEADEIKIKLSDEREMSAQVVGNDVRTDVALIQIKDAKGLTPAVLGSSDKLRVGDVVVAIGNPFGLGNTVTTGIVSAKGRVIGAGPYDDFIQTDASINPGNSGGPLFNLQGEVVGINTAIAREGQGIGFAIPIDMAKRVIEDLMSKGHVIRGWLGVGIQSLDPDLGRMFGMEKPEGALVNQVLKDGPAEKAGLKAGDVVLAIDGQKVQDARDLSSKVAHRKPGTKVVLDLLRDKKKEKLGVVLGELKEQGMEQAETPSQAGQDAVKSLGLMVRPMGPEDSRRVGDDSVKGVVIEDIDPSSPAAEALAPGDIVVEVNRRGIDSLATWSAAMKEVHSGDDVLFKVRREEAVLYMALRAP